MRNSGVLRMCSEDVMVDFQDEMGVKYVLGRRRDSDEK